MKLTKGKLTKIKNKKHQTAKRIKKTVKSNKTKTFRKRKALNLHNNSLKKYKGGQGDSKLPEKEQNKLKNEKEESLANINPHEEKTGESIKENTTVDSSEISDGKKNEVELEQTPGVDQEQEQEQEQEPIIDQELEEPGQVVEKELEEPGQVVEKELEEPGQVVEKELEEPEPVVEKELEEPEPVVEKKLDKNSDEETELISDTVEINPKDKENQISDISEEPINGMTQSEEEVVDNNDASIIEEHPQNNNGNSNNISIIAESLDKLTEYIAEKIAQKINYTPKDELNRDSFNAVANANQTLVEA
jgi:hypothetical protein